MVNKLMSIVQKYYKQIPGTKLVQRGKLILFQIYSPDSLPFSTESMGIY